MQLVLAEIADYANAAALSKYRLFYIRILEFYGEKSLQFVARDSSEVQSFACITSFALHFGIFSFCNAFCTKKAFCIKKGLMQVFEYLVFFIGTFGLLAYIFASY